MLCAIYKDHITRALILLLMELVVRVCSNSGAVNVVEKPPDRMYQRERPGKFIRKCQLIFKIVLLNDTIQHDLMIHPSLLPVTIRRNNDSS